MSSRPMGELANWTGPEPLQPANCWRSPELSDDCLGIGVVVGAGACSKGVAVAVGRAEGLSVEDCWVALGVGEEGEQAAMAPSATMSNRIRMNPRYAAAVKMVTVSTTRADGCVP